MIACASSRPSPDLGYARTVRAALLAALITLLAIGVTDAGSATSSRAILILSRDSGAAGTRVAVTGRNCAKPFRQRDTLAWHDHYYWLHDIEKRPPLGVWRRIPVKRTSATTVHALFVVLRSDHLGRGLLDLFCNGPGEATATFTVTR